MRSSRAPNGLTKAERNGDVGGGISSSRSKTGAKGRKNERTLFESFVFSEKGKGDACGPQRLRSRRFLPGLRILYRSAASNLSMRGENIFLFRQVAK